MYFKKLILASSWVRAWCRLKFATTAWKKQGSIVAPLLIWLLRECGITMITYHNVITHLDAAAPIFNKLHIDTNPLPVLWMVFPQHVMWYQLSQQLPAHLRKKVYNIISVKHLRKSSFLHNRIFNKLVFCSREKRNASKQWMYIHVYFLE